MSTSYEIIGNISMFSRQHARPFGLTVKGYFPSHRNEYILHALQGSEPNEKSISRMKSPLPMRIYGETKQWILQKRSRPAKCSKSSPRPPNASDATPGISYSAPQTSQAYIDIKTRQSPFPCAQPAPDPFNPYPSPFRP